MASRPLPTRVPTLTLLVVGALLAACGAPAPAPPTTGPLAAATPGTVATAGQAVPGADYMIATLTVAAATSRAGIPALPTLAPTVTPTPVPARVLLPLPAGHPMASAWVLDGSPVKLERAARLAVDGDGAIYLLDSLQHRVLKYDRMGGYLTGWGSKGTANGEFSFQVETTRVSSIAADARGNVYVADATHRIQKFDNTGRFLLAWGGEGLRDGYLQRAGSLAVDAQGNLYAADIDNHRVQKFDPNGKFLLKFGIEGGGNGEFRLPSSLAVDGQGHIYVADSLARIQKFDAAGTFLLAWGIRGDAEGEFQSIPQLAIDRQGIVYAADNRTHRIQVFDRQGNYLTQWGLFGSDAGQFRFPGSITIDAQGDIYVADSLNARIQKFKPRAAWPTTVRGTPTPRPPTPTVVPTSTPMPAGPPPFMTPTDR